MKLLNEQIDQKFMAQARKLDQYTRLLQQILPIECRNHVEVANIRNQNLMLITDSPVWTTRLRQLSPQILQFIRENSANTNSNNEKAQIIHHVQINTRYNPASVKQTGSCQKLLAPEKKPPHISEKTAELLSQSANSINHQSLKTALLSLARHGKSDDGTHKNKK
jgi:hypothetical protein